MSLTNNRTGSKASIERGFKTPRASRNTNLILLLIGAAIVFGGASVATSWTSFTYQVFATMIFLIGVLRGKDGTFPLSLGLLRIGCGLLSLILIQIIPLPSGLWTSLPGRELVQANFGVAEIPLSALPVSLKPSSTVAFALAALPVVALSALLAGSAELPTIRVSVMVVLLGLGSWILGVFQATGGTDSPLYIHSFTNRGSAVGFFSNANHLATLLLFCIPLVAALAVDQGERRGISRNVILLVVVGSGVLAALGITLAGSVAGIALLPVAVFGSLFLVPASGKARSFAILGALAGGFAAVAISVGVLGTSLADDDLSRTGIWRTTLMGVKEFWPTGSGLGTFLNLYPMFENPDVVRNRFVNHAHNDYLEVLFEAGFAGAVLIAAVVGWWAVNLIRVWRIECSSEVIWHRAASVVIGLGLAHSFVDYPLRTPALLMVVTFYAFVLGSKTYDDTFFEK